MRQCIDKGSFIEMASLRQFFSLELSSKSVHFIQQPVCYSLTRPSSVCRSQNNFRYLSKLGSQSDRVAGGCSLATHSGAFSEIPESLTASGCSSLKSRARILKNAVRCYMLSIQPRYNAVIATGEGHARFSRI